MGTRAFAGEELLIDLLPAGAEIDCAGQLVVAGCGLRDLAEEHGTPLYVVDEQSLRSQARRFRDTLRKCWPNSHRSSSHPRHSRAPPRWS